MARDDVLEPIRERAYFLWLQAGRPEGGDLAFWDEARRQIERDAGGGPGDQAGGEPAR